MFEIHPHNKEVWAEPRDGLGLSWRAGDVCGRLLSGTGNMWAECGMYGELGNTQTQHRRDEGSSRTFGRHRLHVTRNQIRKPKQSKGTFWTDLQGACVGLEGGFVESTRKLIRQREPQSVTESLHFVCRSLLESLQLHGGAVTAASLSGVKCFLTQESEAPQKDQRNPPSCSSEACTHYSHHTKTHTSIQHCSENIVHDKLLGPLWL